MVSRAVRRSRFCSGLSIRWKCNGVKACNKVPGAIADFAFEKPAMGQGLQGEQGFDIADVHESRALSHCSQSEL